MSCFVNASGISKEQVIEACVMEWGNESYELAEEFVYRQFDGTDILEGDSLGVDFYERSLLIVRIQLTAGAVRLAHLLDFLLLLSGEGNIV